MGRAVGLGVALVATTMALSGCGGDERPSDPGSSPSTSAATGAAPSPAVEPATGPRVRVGSLDVRLPEGFEPQRMTPGVVTATGPDGDRMALVANESLASNTLDELVLVAREGGFWKRPPERLEDVKVDGTVLYHLSGPSPVGFHDDELGAEVSGFDVSVTFGLQGSLEEREQLIASVLGTVQWR